MYIKCTYMIHFRTVIFFLYIKVDTVLLLFDNLGYYYLFIIVDHNVYECVTIVDYELRIVYIKLNVVKSYEII